MNFVKIAATALTLALGIAAASAQTAPAAPVAPKAPVIATTPAPTAPMTATPGAKMKNSAQKKATTPEGQACSAEADAKGLKGKPRVSFRNKCKKEKLAAMKKG